MRTRSNGSLEIGGGQVGRQGITISSSGNYLAGEMSSQSAKVNVDSSGSATIWVTDSLDADLSSSGNVNYYGSLTVAQETTSSGKVVSLGAK